MKLTLSLGDVDRLLASRLASSWLILDFGLSSELLMLVRVVAFEVEKGDMVEIVDNC